MRWRCASGNKPTTTGILARRRTLRCRRTYSLSEIVIEGGAMKLKKESWSL
jgi:hypothetical protein